MYEFATRPRTFLRLHSKSCIRSHPVDSTTTALNYHPFAPGVRKTCFIHYYQAGLLAKLMVSLMLEPFNLGVLLFPQLKQLTICCFRSAFVDA
jgi:hypothetical protein